MSTLTLSSHAHAQSIEAKSPASISFTIKTASLTPSRFAKWDQFVAQHPHGSFFHTSRWLEAVHQAFGHSNMTLVAYRGSEILAGLPLMLVRSSLAGRILVSTPYAVYGGAIGIEGHALDALRRHAFRLAAEVNARSIDLRSVVTVWSDLPTSERYVTFRKPLPDDPARCLNELPRKARAAARAARNRHRLNHETGNHLLPIVWQLYGKTMRRLGSIAYPYRFFAALVDRAPKGSFVSVVHYQSMPVAGLVTWVYRGTAMPYFVGADPRFPSLNAFNYIYLCAMENAVRLGCHTFDFGRSRVDNQGAVSFKRHQGFEPTPLQYQTYTPTGRKVPNLSPSNPRFALARRIWPILPSYVTTRMSNWLSKHIPG